MARLSLSLLGAFEARLDGEPVTGFESNKVRALLAFLAVESHHAHERSYLAGLLWPDWPEAVARTYLRQALANLRTVLHDRELPRPFLEVTRRTLRFDPESDHLLDLSVLQQTLASANVNPGVLSEQSVQRLQEAVDLYRGGLLEGLFLQECSAYEEWQLLTDEQIQQRVVEALQRLVAGYEALGEYAQARQAAQRWADLEPWSDPAHQRLMQLLAANGEPTAAIAHYERFRQHVADELGIAPSQETQALAEMVRSGHALSRPLSPTGSDRQPPHPDLPGFLAVGPSSSNPTLNFVDRETELAQLDAHLARALDGQGHVVLIAGEAGEGKTMLTQEFVRRALDAAPDLVAVSGACDAHTGIGDPYLPFRDIFGSLTGDVEAQWAAGTLTRAHVVRLWQAFPTVLQQVQINGPNLLDMIIPAQPLLARADENRLCDVGTLVELRSLVEQKERDRMRVGSRRQVAIFEEATKVLQAVARQLPLLLVIDDAQWADQGSISLLFHLSRRLRGCRLLLVIAYRPEELTSDRDNGVHPLAPVVDELRRVEENCLVDLRQADGEQFVQALLDAEPNRFTKEFHQRIFRQSQGHALFSVELLHNLQERGDLVHDEDGYWIEGTDLDWELLPSGTEAAIAERINRLSPTLREILSAASVAGERFTAEVIAEILGIPAQKMIQHLSDELDRGHRLVRAVGVQRVADQRRSRYRFRHILFQRYLYQSLDDVERAYLHEIIGWQIERLYRGNAELDAFSAQLALHFEQAGLVEKAVGYRIVSAQRAIRISANHEALIHTDAGLQMLEELPDGTTPAGMEFALQMAQATALVSLKGQATPESGASYARALELSQETGGDSDHYLALWAVWRHYHVKGDVPKSEELADRLLEMARQNRHPLYLKGAHYAAGTTRHASGDFACARQHLEQAVTSDAAASRAFFREAIGDDLDVMGRLFLGLALWISGYPIQAEQRALELCDYALRTEHPFAAGFAQVGAASIYTDLGKANEAERYAEAGWLLAEKHGFDQVMTTGQFYVHWAKNSRQPNEADVVQMAQGLASYEATGARAWGTRWRAILAESYASIAQVHEGLELLNEALAIVEKSGERVYEAEIHRLRGELLLMQRDKDVTSAAVAEVEECYLQAISVARKQQAESWELRATMSLARLWQSQGKVDEARLMLAEIYAWFTEGFDTPDLQKAYALLCDLR